MTVYLDVGVQRIGEYVTRIPKLKQIRGASTAISAATNLEAGHWHGLVGDRIRENDQTGRADGVLHLVVDRGEPEATAREVLETLRRHLPGAQLTASWATAPDYPTAFAQMHSPEGTALTWLPSTNEFPIARPCGSPGSDDRGCGQRPGGSPHGPGNLCADCRRRGPATSESPDAGGSLSRAEELLRSLGRPTRSIQDLCPQGARPPASNHAASIAIDGNGVGGYFARLVADGDAETRRRVSGALRDATESAFLAAAHSVTADGRVGVIPVVLGGDDVVVLTAGVNAWDYLRAFHAEFERAVEVTLGEGTGISASAGLVIHHVKKPVSQTKGLAEDLMRRAKQSNRGRSAAAAWVDTTQDALDDEVALKRRPTVELDRLERSNDALAALASLGQSALGNLRREISELADIPLTDRDRQDYVHWRARRVGAEDAVSAFAYPGSPDEGPLSVEVALDLAQWWPKVGRATR